MRWFEGELPFFKGNLHMHTTRSDGALSPEQAMLLYRQNGYHFVCLTDHNQVGEQAEFQGMLVLPGLELDDLLPDQAVHIVGVGTDPGMPILPNDDRTPQRMIDSIRRAGGRAILAHPAWSLNTVELMASLEGLSAVEIYNTFSGEPWNAERADSQQMLDVLATHGTLLPTVATDDAHRYQGEACRSYTMVQARALTREAILEALDSGSFYASQGPEIRQIELDGGELRIECSPVDRITFCSNRVWVHQRCRSGRNMTEATHQIEPEETFMRVVVTDSFGRKAWSNPIKLTPESPI